MPTPIKTRYLRVGTKYLSIEALAGFEPRREGETVLRFLGGGQMLVFYSTDQLIDKLLECGLATTTAPGDQLSNPSVRDRGHT